MIEEKACKLAHVDVEFLCCIGRLLYPNIKYQKVTAIYYQVAYQFI
jgi:hypothetical protein